MSLQEELISNHLIILIQVQVLNQESQECFNKKLPKVLPILFQDFNQPQAISLHQRSNHPLQVPKSQGQHQEKINLLSLNRRQVFFQDQEAELFHLFKALNQVEKHSKNRLRKSKY